MGLLTPLHRALFGALNQLTKQKSEELPMFNGSIIVLLREPFP